MSARIEVYQGDGAEWDGFVQRQPGATHCHRFGWKAVMEEALGHEGVYLCARDGDGALVGVLPLVSMRSLVFGRYLVSMPFLNYGGPLGTDEAVEALAAEAKATATRTFARRLELRSRDRLAVDLPLWQHKVSGILEIPPGGPDALLASFPSKLRSQIRRAARGDAEVRFGPDQVPAFHQVFSAHMTYLGTPTYAPGFFERIAAEFGPDAWVGCVYLQGRPVAAGFALRHGGEVEMSWASSLAAYNGHSPNMLLYWAFLSRAAEEGLSRFDFGRSTPGSGPHRFKQQWGTREHPLWWYTHSPRGAPGSTSSDVAFAGWAPRLWRRMPVPVARMVGPTIRRGIPL